MHATKEFSFSHPVGGVAYDGMTTWVTLARGESDWPLVQLDSATGAILREIPGDRKRSGLAFDGRNLWMNTPSGIECLDPVTGAVVRTLPLPDEWFVSGLAWDGEALWVGVFAKRQIHRISVEDGRILQTFASDRYVTGIAWVDDELWHGAVGDDEAPAVAVRRLDPGTGDVLADHRVPFMVSGLGFDGSRFLCGDCDENRLRIVEAGAARPQ